MVEMKTTSYYDVIVQVEIKWSIVCGTSEESIKGLEDESRLVLLIESNNHLYTQSLLMPRSTTRNEKIKYKIN